MQDTELLMSSDNEQNEQTDRLENAMPCSKDVGYSYGLTLKSRSTQPFFTVSVFLTGKRSWLNVPSLIGGTY